MAKNPDNPKKPAKTPKSKAPGSKASRPDVQPIGPALAELLNPAINRGESGIGSSTGLQPPPDNSWDRRASGEAAAHRARASTRGTSEDVAKRDAAPSFSPPPAREARGGEGSGVGGGAANSTASEFAEAPPTPNPSPPLRGGRGEAKQGLNESPQREFAPANYGTSATIPALDPELAKQLGFTTEEEDAAAMARPPRNKMEALGVAATADALENLIRDGRPEFKGEDGQLKIWTPHRPPRPEKSEGGVPFVIKSEYEPKGDQPTAITELVEGIARNDRTQVLLGVTGSGKTYTMAKVIEATQRPALILAPNKTLAAQLYGEFKSFFPDNAVEYFVSYYDYYQPEAYVPRTDTYIEKDSSINEQIDRMRHSATRALLERDDVIIVASVSCIYGIGSVETYTAMTFALKKGERIDQRQLIADLVALQYKRTQADFTRGTFRVRGDVIDIFPAHYEDRAWRVNLFGDTVENIEEFDPLTGHKQDELEFIKIYANSHYVTPRPTLVQAIKSIKIRTEAAARPAQQPGPAPGSAAAGAAHHLRSRNDGSDRKLRRHRELFALSHRTPPRRAAADVVRIRARQCAGVRRRKPRHHPADRRHVPRRLPPQGDAGRIRLPAALLHGQPPAALRGMGHDAPAIGRGVGDAERRGS